MRLRALFLFGFSSWTPLALWSTTLTMDTAPAALGWSNWTCLDNTATSLVSSGTLTIVSPSCNEFFAPPKIWNDLVSPTRPWSIETRVRLISGTSEPFCLGPLNGQCFYRSNLGGVQLWLNDGQNVTILDIAADALYLSGRPGVIYPMDTSQFHIYRLDGPGKNVRLSVDDVQVAATTEYLGGTFNLSFGDGAISNPTISEWDYVTIQPNAVPEPGTYSLLVLGLGCLIATSKSLHLVNIHKGRPHTSMSPTAGIFARACRGGSTLPP